MDTKNRADTSAKTPPASPAEPEQAPPLPPLSSSNVTPHPIGRYYNGGFFGSGI
jgi:hypothetical protein